MRVIALLIALCGLARPGSALWLPRSTRSPPVSRAVNGFSRGKLELKRGGSPFSDTPRATVQMRAGASTLASAATFDGIFYGLVGASLVAKTASLVANLRQKGRGGEDSDAPAKPRAAWALQAKFLAVFWLLRMADWLHGPYFYEVYASKMLNGAPVSSGLVSKLFLVGFGATALFGPFVGRAVDRRGRKAGSLAYCALYTMAALSTRSESLLLLILGRLASGVGTSLLFSAPEAWLVGAAAKGKQEKWLGQTFGWAWGGDALVAILAGTLSSVAAASRGPCGPFELSVGFLVLGGLLAALKWEENVAGGGAAAAATADGEKAEQGGASIKDALSIMWKDRRIFLVGAVQALFEGAMYVFVLQWPPAFGAIVDGAVPFGKIFSCFMACCLLGSSLFGALANRGVSVERMSAGMIAAAAASMAASVVGLERASLPIVTAAFFVFEACVGMYFPSIGTMRSKYLPDSHRGVLMNIFGVPLNLIVATALLSIESLGVGGALKCASGALGLAAVAQTMLLARSGKKDGQAV